MPFWKRMVGPFQQATVDWASRSDWFSQSNEFAEGNFSMKFCLKRDWELPSPFFGDFYFRFFYDIHKKAFVDGSDLLSIELKILLKKLSKIMKNVHKT